MKQITNKKSTINDVIKKEKITNSIETLIDNFLKLCFDRTNMMASLGYQDKVFCNKLLEEYNNLFTKYSKYELNQLVDYTRVNTDIQSNLIDVLNNSVMRGNLNSYIDDFGKEINEYLKDRINVLYNNLFIPEDINWISYIINYIRNQLSIYSIVIDEAQRNLIENEEEFFNKVKEEKADLKETVELATTEMKNNTNRAVDEARGVLPHLLTVIGIFVSIIIAVVAIYLNDLIKVESVEKYLNPQLLIARYVVSGHMIIDIILIMLYIVARISDKNILIRCGNFDKVKNCNLSDDDLKYYRPCALCLNNPYCGRYLKLWYKASYILVINFAFIISYLFIFLWWIIENYVWKKLEQAIASSADFEELVSSTEMIFGLVVSGVVVLLIVSLIFSLWISVKLSIKKFEKGKNIAQKPITSTPTQTTNQSKKKKCLLRRSG